MSYTLGEAAKAVGKSKTTIHRAIKSGKISASKADDGSYSIEASELHRVFPAVTVRPLHSNDTWNDQERQSNTLEALRIKLNLLENERERERSQMQSTIDDLREDRDRWRQQASALLEDHRPKGFFKTLFWR